MFGDFQKSTDLEIEEKKTKKQKKTRRKTKTEKNGKKSELFPLTEKNRKKTEIKTKKNGNKRKKTEIFFSYSHVIRGFKRHRYAPGRVSGCLWCGLVLCF